MAGLESLGEGGFILGQTSFQREGGLSRASMSLVGRSLNVSGWRCYLWFMVVLTLAIRLMPFGFT